MVLFCFFFFLGIYLFSLNNIVRRHTTLTSLHREKIMWKAERQRKFKNISLLSRIQYVLYIQRRAKSILMKTVYNPGLQTPVFIKVSCFFSCSFLSLSGAAMSSWATYNMFILSVLEQWNSPFRQYKEVCTLFLRYVGIRKRSPISKLCALLLLFQSCAVGQIGGFAWPILVPGS